MKHEMQNCFAEAQMAYASHAEKQDALIASHVAAGRFVVVRLSEWRCQSTDAFVCMARGFNEACATRDEANDVAALKFEANDCEDRFVVVPSLEMEAFRASGLPDDAFSEWKSARRAEAAMERAISDRMGEPPF